jgi:glycosyltransferase involved in cell wall biosynthesis
MQTAVVVPCYNEEHRLDGDACVQFLEATTGVRLLFVDDGSTDATWERLGSIVARAPAGRADRLRLEKNVGKAEAVRRGLNELLRQGATDYVGFWDADLATPLEDIPAFVQLLEERPDIQWVFGARVKLLGRAVERHSIRHVLGRVFATLTSMALALPVYDTQCGAKLFRVSPALAESLQAPFDSRWIFEVELIARASTLAGDRRLDPDREIYELPLHAWRDVRGSKVRSSDFVRAGRELASIWWRYRPARRKRTA